MPGCRERLAEGVHAEVRRERSKDHEQRKHRSGGIGQQDRQPAAGRWPSWCFVAHSAGFLERFEQHLGQVHDVGRVSFGCQAITDHCPAERT